MPKWVQVLDISRHYGGPEEGGWWYDWTTILFEKKYPNRVAKKMMKQLSREVALEQPRYNRFSVLGDYDLEVSCGRRVTPSRYRPRYE